MAGAKTAAPKRLGQIVPSSLKQDLTHDLINSGRYDTKDDFTMVIQPFFKNIVLPYTKVFSFLTNIVKMLFSATPTCDLTR